LDYHHTFPSLCSRARHELGMWHNMWTQPRDAWWSRIGERRLYLGPQPIEERGDRHTLRSALNVTRLVTLLERFEREPGWLYTPVNNLSNDVDPGHLWLPVVDHEPLQPAVLLHSWVRALHKLLSSEHTVYVHCRAGKGRSASLVAAYLMFAERLSAEQALLEVRRWRPQIAPNAAQRRALMHYEDWLHHWFKLRKLRKQCNQCSSNNKDESISIEASVY
jgi:protein-tyrosine phosphatase